MFECIRGYTVSVLSGCLLGVLMSAITNSTLVEISLNTFFAFYFGLLFLLIGFMILWRIVVSKSQMESSRKPVLAVFACLVVVSGVLCLIFKHRWFFTMSVAQKVPIYCTIGISGEREQRAERAVAAVAGGGGGVGLTIGVCVW